ncbi:MAG: hypothetical protein KDA66_06175 [Planctomycetaceae bacterium]|nr:hypothetical protein [Planctomycetaceae bacterium]
MATDSISKNSDAALGSFQQVLHATLTDGRKFWTRAQLAYNLVIGLYSIAFFFTYIPESYELLNSNTLMTYGFLAVCANVLFLAAYLPELVIRKMKWEQAVVTRLLVFFVGTLFALLLTELALGGLLAQAVE